MVKPSYRQFYIRRGDEPWASDAVSDEGYARGVEAVGGFVYVGTTMFGNPTTVVVEVGDSPPSEVTDADRCAEVTVEGDGQLAVFSWGEDDPVGVVEVPPGPLRLRVAWAGSSAAAAHPDADIGGDSLSDESIHIQVWPAR